MSDDPNYLRLYILMRNDLEGLNPGKAMAQAAHAANACVAEAPSQFSKQVTDWQNQTTQGFGTTIVLSATEAQMRVRTRMARDSGYHAGIVHDPTYPLSKPTPPFPTLAATLIVGGLSIIMMIAGLTIGALVIIAFAVISMICADIIVGLLADRRPKVIPADTCGYIFGDARDVQGCVIGLNLHR